MGMFDDIRCDMELPAEPAPPKHRNFQTKFADEPYLDKYVITADGTLLVDRTGSTATEVVDYHGDLEFHDFDSETGEWWSYIARFTEGRCIRIWCAEYRKDYEA